LLLAAGFMKTRIDIDQAFTVQFLTNPN